MKCTLCPRRCGIDRSEGIDAAGNVEMLNVGVKNPSDPIEQIADIIERSPEIISRVKALLGKDKTEE